VLFSLWSKRTIVSLKQCLEDSYLLQITFLIYCEYMCVFTLWPPWEVCGRGMWKVCVKRWLNIVFGTNSLWRFHLCVRPDLGSSIYVWQLWVLNIGFDLCCKRLTRQWEDFLFALNLGSLVDYPQEFWSILKTV